MAVVEQPPVPQLITEEEVRAIAAAEGLVLVPAPSSSTGYKGVTRTGCVGKPFKAQARQDGSKKNLGHYATAAEASLAYVRHLGPDLCAVEAWRATTTAIPAASSEPEHTAQQLAASEGLVLVPAPGTATGYKGVTRSGSGTKPFKVQVRQAGGLGKSVKRNLGCYGTAAAQRSPTRGTHAPPPHRHTAATAAPMPAEPPAAAEQVCAAQIPRGPCGAEFAAPAHAGPMHPGPSPRRTSVCGAPRWRRRQLLTPRHRRKRRSRRLCEQTGAGRHTWSWHRQSRCRQHPIRAAELVERREGVAEDAAAPVAGAGGAGGVLAHGI